MNRERAELVRLLRDQSEPLSDYLCQEAADELELASNPRPTIAATLRQVASWGSSILISRAVNDLDETELRRLADEVENGDASEWICCPLCEEIDCDGGCPLHDFRAAFHHDERGKE